MTSKHVKPSEPQPSEVVGLFHVCDYMLQEILTAVPAEDSTTLSVQPLTCQRLRNACAVLPVRRERIQPGGAFVRHAFSAGDLDSLRWAHRHKIRTHPLGSVEWPPAWASLPATVHTNLSPFDAALAIHADGRADDALWWYLGNFFFPALGCLPLDWLRLGADIWHPATEDLPDVAYFARGGSVLIREAAIS